MRVVGMEARLELRPPRRKSGLWLWLKKEGWLWTHPKGLWDRTKTWVFLWGKENDRPLLIEWFPPNEETPFEKRSRANWLTVELAQVSFPPTITKFGFNAEWTEKNPERVHAIGEAAKAGVPMVAGLMEIWTTNLGGFRTNERSDLKSDPELDEMVTFPKKEE